MGKVWLKIFAAAISLTLILSACASGNKGNNGSGPDGGDNGSTGIEQKEVLFTIGYASGDRGTKEAIEYAIKAFMEANPAIQIVDISETTSSSYLDWLKIKDAVGEFPDLVEIRDTKIFADAGKIAELPSDLQRLFENLPTVDGKAYNVPIYTQAPHGLIYSKQAYEAAGITKLPQTYDEFLAIQEKLKASGITPIAIGGKDIFHMGFWTNKFLIDQLYANDPDWNSKRTSKQVSFTDANVVQAITDYKELFANYVNKDWLSTADNQIASMLISGKAAQLFSGPWMFGQIEQADPDFEFGWYPVPDRQGKTNIVGLPSPIGWSLSTDAMKDADKTEAMKKFIRFFLEPEQYAKYLKTTNAIPTTKEKITYEVGEQMQEVLRVMADPNVHKSLAINNWWGENQIPPEFRNWFYKLLQDLVIKDGDVYDYMKRADAEYDKQVKAIQQ
ncbi:hypothetical protein PAECIP111893_03051 [Paenibacillus plantiphilus]|uniref:ABC transporter substrate-binding protein n=1 Tax=Paenibacillus plantiphilus TaxID=2905650 RepID=A0ABN8GMN1_9BACL|nr:extracellular solute-binding protein [Paenibacillus plantiphilus]CAH1209540.1 hypothetical protein PAECIP111893_03051 [Paenibacillus plantiphilus]